MANINRMQSIDTAFIDNANVFIETNSPTWRAPLKVSVKDLLNILDSDKLRINDVIDQNTIIIDKKTFKIKVNEDFLKAPSVVSKKFIDQNIFYNNSPIDASMISGMYIESAIYLTKDKNFLYVWVGDRWKRIALSEW